VCAYKFCFLPGRPAGPRCDRTIGGRAEGSRTGQMDRVGKGFDPRPSPVG